MFDPELAILLLDLDESVHCWLRAEGVEHCSDIHFGWSSEDDFLAAFWNLWLAYSWSLIFRN